MKKAFLCSLCRDGILGGGLYLDEQAVAYRTQKLTADKKYHDLVLSLSKITDVTWRWRVFPVATFRMDSGESYDFIIFNRWRFERCYQQYHDK